MDAETLLPSGMRDEIETWPPRRSPGPGGVSVARFVGLDAEGRFLVRLADGARALPALSTVGLGAADAGVQVVVAAEGGDPQRPVILGRVQRSAPPAGVAASVRVDGDRLVLQAERQIELRCGDASIVLTAAGKVLIRGAYVQSRARGANRIQGAYVDIN